MERRQVFDTTLYDEANDLAFGVMSIPFVGGDAPDLPTVLAELGLRPVAEIPQERLNDAVSALLATTDVSQTMSWLLDPPDPVQLLLPDDVVVQVTRRDEVAKLSDRKVRAPAASARAEAPAPRIRKPEQITKQAVEVDALNSFAGAAVPEALVPLQRSPIDLHPFMELSDEAFRALIVTPRSNPLIVVYNAAALLVFYSVITIVRGGVRGVAAGVRYRAMKRWGVPDDIIRAQMGAPPRREDQNG